MVKGRGKGARMVASSSPRNSCPLSSARNETSSSSDNAKLDYDIEDPARQEPLAVEEAQLGMGGGEFSRLMYSRISPMETRADFERTLGVHGTPEMLFKRLIKLSERLGAPQAARERFAALLSPQAMRERLEKTRYSKYLVREVVDVMEGLLPPDGWEKMAPCSPGTGAVLVNAVDVRQAYFNAFARFDAHGLRHTLEQAFEGEDDARARSYFDKRYGARGNRARTVERLAEEEGVPVKDVKEWLEYRLPGRGAEDALGEAEIERAVAITEGRRYLWPDEKDGSYRGT